MDHGMTAGVKPTVETHQCQLNQIINSTNHQLNQNINSTMQCVSRSDTKRYNFVQSINISATQHEHVCQDPDIAKQVHYLCLNAIYSLLEFSTISRYTVMYVTYPNCSENVQKT